MPLWRVKAVEGGTIKHRSTLSCSPKQVEKCKQQVSDGWRMEVVLLAKAGADNADESPSLRAVQLSVGLPCLLLA